MIRQKKILFSRLTGFLFILFILSGSSGFAQNYDTKAVKPDFKFESLSLENGLSQGNVKCILQDKQGFLWLGTQDGLNRFDGNNFVVFKHVIGDSNSLSHNYIYTLEEDKDGNIWIATGGGGICRYNPFTNSFNRYIKDDQGSNLITVLCVYIDSENQIWAGTYLTGLSKYNPGTDSFYSLKHNDNDPKSFPSSVISAIYEDREKNLWLGSVDVGLINFNRSDSSFKIYNEANGLASNFIISICEDNKGNLVIGTEDGLSIFNEDHVIANYYHEPDNQLSVSSNEIRPVLADENGNVFIGTANTGIDYFIPGKNVFFNYRAEDKTPFTINDNSIFSVYKDRSGIIWMGTNRGLNKIKKTKKFDILLGPNSKDPLSGKNVWSVLEDRDKNIWAGTDKGLIRFDTKEDKVRTIKGFAVTGNIEDKIIYSLSEDEQGNIWIGTNSGLSCLDKQTNNLSTYYYYDTDDQGLYNLFRSIYIEKDIIWLGTNARGIIKFDPVNKTFTPFSASKNSSELLNKYVLYQTHKDKKSNYWFCTSTGLFTYNPLTDEVTSALSSFDNKTQSYTGLYNQSLCLYDAGEYFWIGTSGGGLVKLIPGRGVEKRFTEKQGLSNNVVYAILPDSSGNLWLSTNKGISEFDIRDETFKNYYLSDGLPSDEFNSGSYYSSADGKLYFGSINGFVSFYPDEIKDNEYLPPVAITSFKVFDKPYFDKLIFPDDETIELSYSDNFFSFEFAALDFTDPGKNQYAYMLEGFDKDWNFVGNRHFASYTNIDPGKYVFKVRGSNNDGIWNEKGASLSIIISPPFYSTWWAYTFYGFAFVFILFSLRKYDLNKRKKKEEAVIKKEREQAKLREAQLRAEKAELQAKAVESEKEFEKQNIRSRIASDLHDEIGSNLSSIGLLSSILMNDIDEEKVNQGENKNSFNKLSDIQNAARSSAESIRDIVWFTNPMTDQLSSLVTRMTETATMMLGNINYDIDTGETSSDEKINPEIKRNIYLIYKETLNNIIKHSQAGKVNISVKKDEGIFSLIIEDNGAGFETGKNNSGNGLKNITSRAKQVNGKLEINSAPGNGTKIILKVPL